MDLTLLLILSLQLVFTPNIVAGASRRIVNGGVIEHGQWPFLVSLHYMKPHSFTAHTKMQHLCGGSLIDPYWILTAAHCFSNDASDGVGDVTRWKAVVGENNQFVTDEGEQTLEIEQAILHPEFDLGVKNANLLHDVALLRLKTPANLTEFVEVIDLNTDEDLEGTECQIGGWGQMTQEPYGFGMYLPLKTNVTVVNTDKCSTTYKHVPFLKVDESTICATYPVSGEVEDGDANDACNGDSGGPLICKTGWWVFKKAKLCGIVSAGYKCGDAIHPGIYTNVSYFSPWIEDTMSSY